MIRPLEEQFPATIVKHLFSLIDRIGTITYPNDASRYYAADLKRVLKSGSLLAALCLGSTLLEIVIRGLVINYCRVAAQKHINLEGLLEAKKEIGFANLVDALHDAGMVSEVDATSAKKFYNDIRIPIQHGLSQRFVHSHYDEQELDFKNFLRQGQSITLHELEEIVEDHAIEHLELLIGLLERVTSSSSA